jgi:hypothetical protein
MDDTRSVRKNKTYPRPNTAEKIIGTAVAWLVVIATRQYAPCCRTYPVNLQQPGCQLWNFPCHETLALTDEYVVHPNPAYV